MTQVKGSQLLNSYRLGRSFRGFGGPVVLYKGRQMTIRTADVYYLGKKGFTMDSPEAQDYFSRISLARMGDKSAIKYLKAIESRGKPPLDSKLYFDVQGSPDLKIDNVLRIVEIGLIKQALVRTLGNKTQAARLLGIVPQTVGNKMNRLGIKKDDIGDWLELPQNYISVNENSSLVILDVLRAIEQNLIIEALKRSKNKKRAAELLGVEYQTLFQKIKRLNI